MIPASSERALDGFRVLDLSRILAGPYATMLLGDQGADVIKVERPGTGDDTRRWGPPFEAGISAYYLCCNRNKRSVTIDLKAPEGLALVRRLLADCDVLVHNFLQCSMERLGLGYEQLAAEFPGLVYASISAFGEDGPYAERPGYDMVLQAVGGMMHITGEPLGQGGSPAKVGVAITDVLTGVHAAGAITTALLHRERTGRGQKLDVALLDAQVAGLANIASSWLVSGVEARRWGTAHPSIVPYQVFDAADRPIAVAAANERMWGDLCRVLERPEWIADERFSTNPARVEHRDVLLPLVQERLTTRTCDDWLEPLTAAGIPCGPVNDMQHLFADPQVVARGLVETVEHPTLGALPQVRNPVRSSATPPAIDRHPPLLGEHTAEVLGELLGVEREELGRLRDAGVV